MKTSHTLLLCILGIALVSTVACYTGSPGECCFDFHLNRINKGLMKSYYRTDKQCTKTGVILVSKKDIKICVDPSLSWVQNIMKHLDKKL